LVINRGTEDGVRVGMYFEVLAREGENIKDPETGDILGSVDRPKVAVRVVQVKDRLAVARTFRKTTRNLGGSGIGAGAFAEAFKPPRYVTEYENLKTTEDTWESLRPQDSYVKIGDPVRQIAKPDDAPN
jgi:hypothetical protein